jgi:transposase-like protein
LSGQTPKAAALAAGVCPRTIRKWVARYRAEALAGFMIAAHGHAGRAARHRRRLS